MRSFRDMIYPPNVLALSTSARTNVHVQAVLYISPWLGLFSSKALCFYVFISQYCCAIKHCHCCLAFIYILILLKGQFLANTAQLQFNTNWINEVFIAKTCCYCSQNTNSNCCVNGTFWWLKHYAEWSSLLSRDDLVMFLPPSGCSCWNEALPISSGRAHFFSFEN